MSEVGFCLIHRTLLGHPAFRNDGEAMAFAWLVLRASWRPVAVRYKGKAIQLDRGQLALSVRDFSAAIDRPKGWVERLLKRLENGTMVETHSETGVTVLTICNYDKYQADQDTRRTLHETVDETDAGHRTKKITKNKEQIDSLSSDFDEFWKQYPRKVGKGAAMKAYAKARKENDHATLVGAISAQRTWGVWADDRFIPHASTWLNEQRWLDERPKQAHGAKPSGNRSQPPSMAGLIAESRAARAGEADLSGDGWLPTGTDGVYVSGPDGRKPI